MPTPATPPVDGALNRALGAACGLASPAGHGARLSILIYHRVLPAPDPLLHGEVDAARFDWQMALVARHFHVLPLTEAVERLGRGALPTRALAITFDDGYADNLSVALPVLQKHGLSATFFVAAGFLDGGRMWNDTVIEAFRAAPGPAWDLGALGLGTHPVTTPAERRAGYGRVIAVLKYLPFAERAEKVQALAAAASLPAGSELMLSSTGLRRLRAAGMEIGGHTVSHPILLRLDEHAARREIAEGKERLEGLLGERLRLFAYPNGKPGQDYGPAHVDMVRSLGFRAALSTTWGAARAGDDPFQLVRFTPWDASPGRFHLRLLRNYFGH